MYAIKTLTLDQGITRLNDHASGHVVIISCWAGQPFFARLDGSPIYLVDRREGSVVFCGRAVLRAFMMRRLGLVQTCAGALFGTWLNIKLGMCLFLRTQLD